MYACNQRTRSLICIICLAALLLSGCGIAKSVNAASSVTDSYYDAMKQKDYDKLLTMYSDTFFEKKDKDEWKDSLAVINKKLGDLKSYKLTGWNVNIRAGIGGNAEVYVLTYSVEYSKYNSTEVFTIVRHGKDSPLLIEGQNINSEGFLKDVNSQSKCNSRTRVGG